MSFTNRRISLVFLGGTLGTIVTGGPMSSDEAALCAIICVLMTSLTIIDNPAALVTPMIQVYGSLTRKNKNANEKRSANISTKTQPLSSSPAAEEASQKSIAADPIPQTNRRPSPVAHTLLQATANDLLGRQLAYKDQIISSHKFYIEESDDFLKKHGIYEQFIAEMEGRSVDPNQHKPMPPIDPAQYG